jgi:hypothetical protein
MPRGPRSRPPAGIHTRACLRSRCAWRATGEIHRVTGWRKNGWLFTCTRLYAVRRRALIGRHPVNVPGGLVRLAAVRRSLDHGFGACLVLPASRGGRSYLTDSLEGSEHLQDRLDKTPGACTGQVRPLSGQSVVIRVVDGLGAVAGADLGEDVVEADDLTGPHPLGLPRRLTP